MSVVSLKLQRKEAAVSVGEEVVWVPSRPGRCGEITNSLPLSEMKLSFLRCLTPSLITIPTELSQLQGEKEKERE
jgi:hypothetical protein